MPDLRWALLAHLLTLFALLLPQTSPLAALLLVCFWPGWGWSFFFALPPGSNSLVSRLDRLGLTLALSVSISSLITLLLAVIPGPLNLGPLLIGLSSFSLLPWAVRRFQRWRSTHPLPTATRSDPASSALIVALLLIFIPAILLRIGNLAYSEFQGDEALAMLTAAETITGNDAALFQRSKGPGEVLLPLAVWRLNQTITEWLARSPFVIANLAALLTFTLLAIRFFNPTWANKPAAFPGAALTGAAFLAGGGFMLAFGRIVQYQSLVLWFSLLAIYTAWRWRESGQLRWAVLSGLFFGLGLLAHYDAVVVLPVVAWLWLADSWAATQTPGRKIRPQFVGLGLWLMAFSLPTLLFYPRFIRHPQVDQTGAYLSDRLGASLLSNNLFEFLHFYSFYSSFYFLIFGLFFLLAFLAWAGQGHRWGRWWLPSLSLGFLTWLCFNADTLGNYTGLGFGLILLLAFASPNLDLPLRLSLIWFSGTFLGYNFIVESPLTHIYTVLPAWALLVGWIADRLVRALHIPTAIQWVGGAGLIALSSAYLGLVFVLPQTQFLLNYPGSNPPLYWTPFTQRPQTGFFGFPSQFGWKAIGALYQQGMLDRDYDSNQKEAVTSWYTRRALRSCNEAEFYFDVGPQVEPVSFIVPPPPEQYQRIGQINRPHGRIYVEQLQPTSFNADPLDYRQLARQFDATATPSAFALDLTWNTPSDVNFGGQIRLRGYDLDLRRAYPGGRILITLYWQAETHIDTSYKAFLHLDSQEKYAQADSVPYCASFPTDRWQPGQIIPDHRVLNVRPDAPPGNHPLALGLYALEDGQHLDVLDVAGNPAGITVLLETVNLRPGP